MGHPDVCPCYFPRLRIETWGTQSAEFHVVAVKFNDELDGADAIEGCDGAAGDDGELGGERGDGDEAEVSAAVEEFISAEGGGGGVEFVAPGERGGAGRVVEVPHERRGVEEANGGDAEAG